MFNVRMHTPESTFQNLIKPSNDPLTNVLVVASCCSEKTLFELAISVRTHRPVCQCQIIITPSDDPLASLFLLSNCSERKWCELWPIIVRMHSPLSTCQILIDLSNEPLASILSSAISQRKHDPNDRLVFEHIHQNQRSKCE